MADPEISQLRWRCRRGMKELDLLLLRYVEQEYPDSGAEPQRAFRRLLSMPDPEILNLLTGRSVAEDSDLVAIVESLLKRD
jgi:antitoxin CptB